VEGRASASSGTGIVVVFGNRLQITDQPALDVLGERTQMLFGL
jgi:hypothetical protein